MTAPADLPRNHARTHGSPGERARFAGLLRAVWPLLGVSLLAGYLIRALIPWPPMGQSAVGLGFLVLAVVSSFVLGICSSRVGAFLKGARGEERVASTLAFLPAEYTVFNGLCVDGGRLMPRGGDFDHIVVGPTGFFVIETKNWQSPVVYEDGKLLYEDGKEPQRPPLDQARAAAERLHGVLKSRLDIDINVRSVVCFVGNRFADGRRELKDATICNLDDLLSVVLQTRGKAVSIDSSVSERVSGLLCGWVALETDDVVEPDSSEEESDSDESDGDGTEQR